MALTEGDAMKSESCATTCGPITADLGLLVLRVVAGLSLATHGWAKFHDPQMHSMFFEGVKNMGMPFEKFPTAFAWAATAAELGGGILLALGFLTRVAAFFILCVMGTAIWKVHLHDPYQKMEPAVIYAAIALCLLFAGGGRISLGAMLFCRRKDKDEPEAPEEVRESMRPL